MFAHLVSEEKTLAQLAVAYLVDLEELAALNELPVDAVLSPDDRITIPPSQHDALAR